MWADLVRLVDGFSSQAPATCAYFTSSCVDASLTSVFAAICATANTQRQKPSRIHMQAPC